MNEYHHQQWLANCSPAVLINQVQSVSSLLELRQRRAGFWSYVREFDQQWSDAATKRDRWHLGNEWAAAIAKLGEREDPSNAPFLHYLEYSEKPAKIVEAIGDKLANRGKEESIIHRVNGLHDFWDDLAKAPTDEVTNTHLARLFPKRLDDNIWDLGRKLAETLNRHLPQSPAAN